MSKKALFAMLSAAAMMAQHSDNFYRYGERKRYPVSDSGNGFSKTSKGRR